MLHLRQEKNEWVASLEQEEVLLEPQKGEEVSLLEQEKNECVASLEQEEVLLEQQKGEVSLLEQEHLVPQRISEGQLQKHSSCFPEEWWMKQQPGKPGEQLLLLEIKPLLLVLGGKGGAGVDDEQQHPGGGSPDWPSALIPAWLWSV